MKTTGADNVRSIKVDFESVSSNTPIMAIVTQIGLDASIDAGEIFSALIDSINPPQIRIQLKQLFDHFHSLINVDDGARGSGGTKLTMTIKSIIFRKHNISGCISLLDELGVQTTNKRPHSLEHEEIPLEHEDVVI